MPLLTGLALSPWLFRRYGHGDQHVFALFIGTAMSVTAFPVLARIMMERGMIGSRLGTVALACAAASDLVAWILLAVAVSMTTQGRDARPLWQVLVLLIICAIALAGAGRLLTRWARGLKPGELQLEILVAFVVLALLSGAAGEWIGVHAVVGAFGAGIVTPREFRAQLIDKLESITIVLLLPLFFALTGIHTNLIFSGAGSYWDLGLILLAATASKWGGTLLGARTGGMPWREASQLGVLMNARGLVELIVLNAGLESGILPPAVFSMMVCMALFTAFITSPLLDRIDPKMTWTRLYDPHRMPSHWTDIVREDQLVVFISDARTQAPRDADGRPFCAADGSETGQHAALCEDVAEARDFARQVAARHPELCCRIYDSEGKSRPPLRVIYTLALRKMEYHHFGRITGGSYDDPAERATNAG